MNEQAIYPLTIVPADIEWALENAQKLVELYPDDESAWFLLAATLKESLLPSGSRWDLDRVCEHPCYSQLIDSFDRLIELNPGEPTHRWNRAMIKHALCLFTEATEDLQVFVEEVKPEHAESAGDYRAWLASAYDHLGCNLLGIGATDAALGALRKAVELSPDYRPAWEDLSTVYEILGDEKSASDCLDRAAAIIASDK